jgi:hypothetical protein
MKENSKVTLRYSSEASSVLLGNFHFNNRENYATFDNISTIIAAFTTAAATILNFILVHFYDSHLSSPLLLQE